MLLDSHIGSVDSEDSLEIYLVNIPFLSSLPVNSACPMLLSVIISWPYDLLNLLLAHLWQKQIQILAIQVFHLIVIWVVGCSQQENDLGVLHLLLVIIRHAIAVSLRIAQIIHRVVQALYLRGQLSRPLYADAAHRSVVVCPRQDGGLQSAHIVHRQKLSQEEAIHIAWFPQTQIDIVAVAILRHLQHYLHSVCHQVGILSDGEVSKTELDQLGDLAVGFVRSHHEFDVFGMQGSHGGGDDALVDDDASGEVLPRLLLIADLQIIQSPLSILLFAALSFLQRLLLLAHVLAIEHAYGPNIVVEQQIQHLKHIVEEIIGIDVLVEFEGAAVAALVEPGHDVDHCRLALEAADVLLGGDWSQKFQKSLDSHWRQFMIIKSNKIIHPLQSFPINTMMRYTRSKMGRKKMATLVQEGVERDVGVQADN